MYEENSERTHEIKTRTEIKAFCRRLKRSWGDDLVTLALFGSRVRGNARPESDIDLLIVKKDLPSSRLDRTLMVYRLAQAISEEYAHRLSAICYTPDEARIIKPFYLDMLAHVKILVDREEFFQQILDQLRARLHSLGARRLRDANGHSYWLLKEDLSY